MNPKDPKVDRAVQVLTTALTEPGARLDMTRAVESVDSIGRGTTMTDKKDESTPMRGSLQHLQTRTIDSRAHTSEAQDRLKTVLELGRNLAPSAARDELLRGIEMVRARVYVLNRTQYDELGKTIGFLLDILMDHLKSGALRFDPSEAAR